MGKIIEISVFKIATIITGILSLVFAWATIVFQGVIGLFTINASGDYNFIGYLTRMNLGSLILENPGVYQITLLTLFGVLYLIGFLLTLMNVKIDNKDTLKVLGGLGLLLIIIGIFGYIFTFLDLFYKNKLLIDEDVSSLYTNYSFDFFFNAGFYLAIGTIIFISLELFYKNQRYIQFSLAKSQNIHKTRRKIINGTNKKNIVKFCGLCGAKNPIKTGTFCYKCGAALTI